MVELRFGGEGEASSLTAKVFSAPVYVAAVLEYLTAEILELAAKAAADNKRQRIVPRHIMLAVRNDEELNALLGSAVISGGGVLPCIQPALLPKSKKSKSAGVNSENGGNVAEAVQ